MRKLFALASSRRVRSVVAVMVLAVLGVGAVNLDHRTTRQRGEAWAAAHASARPMSLEELAAYPADYRQAIFQALPAADQSRLWRVQLQRVLDTEPNLNAGQRAFIAKVMDMATPASFVKDMPNPEVCQDIARLFTNPNQKERVRTIGAGIAPVASLASSWVSATERLRSAVSLGAEKFPCSCRGQGLCECGLIAACVYGDCEHTQNCGCIWAGECDKMCIGVLPPLNLKAK